MGNHGRRGRAPTRRHHLRFWAAPRSQLSRPPRRAVRLCGPSWGNPSWGNVLLLILLLSLTRLASASFYEAIENPTDIPGGELPGMNMQWSQKIQAIMISFMLRNGLSAYEAANKKNGARHDVPRRTLSRWMRHFLWWGETPAATAQRRKRRPFRGKTSPLPHPAKQYLKKIVDDNPALYIDEMQQELRRQFNVKWSIPTIHRTLTNSEQYGGLNYSLKKLTYKAIQANRAERRLYLARLRQYEDPRQFIFIDESTVGANESRRRRGWGRRGHPTPQYSLYRGEDTVKGDGSGHKDTFTLIAAVDMDGFVIPACETVYRQRGEHDYDPTHGTIDQERFYQYVVTRLVPILGREALDEPRSVVVLDNATIHKDPRVVEAIRAVGAVVVWTAAYSPDLNPIERCFSLYKRFLRRHFASFSRTPRAVHLRALRVAATPKDVRGFYQGRALQGAIRNVPSSEDDSGTVLVTTLAVAVMIGVFE